MIQERLDALLRQLDPSRLEITNDSYLHGNPPESGTHFKVIMVSDRFSDLTRVKRHQLVYATCQELLQNPIHALALHLETRHGCPAPPVPVWRRWTAQMNQHTTWQPVSVCRFGFSGTIARTSV